MASKLRKSGVENCYRLPVEAKYSVICMCIKGAQFLQVALLTHMWQFISV